MKFPTIKQVEETIRKCVPISDREYEIALHVEESGQWCIKCGVSDDDPDWNRFEGFWAETTVQGSGPGNVVRCDVGAIARELILQCREAQSFNELRHLVWYRN